MQATHKLHRSRLMIKGNLSLFQVVVINVPCNYFGFHVARMSFVVAYRLGNADLRFTCVGAVLSRYRYVYKRINALYDMMPLLTLQHNSLCTEADDESRMLRCRT